jgi:hypothetical protein
MNQKDLLLVGGGLIAGYVICKMMNPTPSSESFSADGVQRGYAGKKFQFNGKGLVLGRRAAGGNWKSETSQRYLNTPITLTGKSKKVQLSNDPTLASNGQYEESSSPNAMEYLESTLSISYPITSSSGQVTGNTFRKMWFPKDSLVQI